VRSPYQDERVEALQPLGESVGLLDVVREDRHVVALEPLDTRQLPQRVEPVVEDRDPHCGGGYALDFRRTEQLAVARC
jgi:hypothetical protein